jgi:hypothetical protein
MTERVSERIFFAASLRLVHVLRSVEHLQLRGGGSIARRASVELVGRVVRWLW